MNALSHNQHPRNPGTEFPAHYIDPLSGLDERKAFAKSAVADFNKLFPNSKRLLKENINDLNRIKGDGHHGVSTPICLREYDWRTAGPDDSPSGVTGELSPMQHALLETLYKVTNSETKRDDRAAGEEQGVIIRRGSIEGRSELQTVYFQERFTGLGDSAKRSFTVTDGPSGQRILKSLSQSEEAEFKALSGHDIDSGGDGEFFPGLRDRYDITRENYKLIALGLAHLDLSPEAKGYEIDRKLGSLASRGENPVVE